MTWNDWQGTDTAPVVLPMDELTRALLFGPSVGVHIGRIGRLPPEFGGAILASVSHISGLLGDDVTHWMPLPAPPVEIGSPEETAK